MVKHWSKMEYLAEVVKKPNIIIKGKHSYYSNAWSGNFEDYVVRIGMRSINYQKAFGL